MTTSESPRRSWLVPVAIICVLALVIAVGVVYLITRPSGNRYAAMLTTTIGLYPGADVRVLGVRVGEVEAVTPQGQLVRVDFRVEDDVPVPADALAAVVAPTVVADRYLQLAPAYTGGPTMAEGTVIPPERTAAPAEFDDLLASVQKLSTSLGPQGVNANGALSEALTTAARNLQGNGQRLNTTLDNTAQALTTLSTSREDIAGTVRNLQAFTTNLKENDAKVREFTRQFAEVNGFLAEERENLGATLRELSIALGDVARFVHDNRAEIKSNVDKLADVLAAVNSQRLQLEQALETAPMGLDGLVNAYNASSGTLDTRLNLVGTVLCSLYNSAPGPLQAILGPLLETFLPGGLAGCANTGAAPLQLPPAAVSKLNNPKLPMMLGVPGLSSGSTPAAGAASALGAPSQAESGSPSSEGSTSGDESSEASESQPAPVKRGGPPSLGELLGGGR